MISGGGYRNRTGLLGFAIQSKSEQNQGAVVSKKVATKREPIGKVSNPVIEAKENPGARAGATGEHSIDRLFKTEEYRKRARAATSLGLAIADCHPADACELMEAALSGLTAGAPIAPLFSIMDGASFWTDLQPQAVLKAYFAATFNRLTPENKAAARAYVNGGRNDG